MPALGRWLVAVSLIALGLLSGSLLGASSVQGQPQVQHIIYDDALNNSWQD
jgi:hypothetical protein